MTTVFITRTGERYHAIGDCPSFQDLSERLGRPVATRGTDLRGLAQTPCSVCWPETSDWDQWRQLAHRVERTGDSDYEVTFVEQVLRHVRGISASDVQTQRKAHGKSGSVYYLDFVIEPHGGRQIAVEVDGHQKSREKSADTTRRESESKRTDLKAAGWRVVNFSDTQVATRSDECISELRSELTSAQAPRPESPAVTPPTALGEPRSPATNEGRDRRFVGKLLAGTIGLALIAGAGLWWVSRDNDPDPVAPIAGDCPDGSPVKGNVTDDGERIYHEPGWRYYSNTNPEECFEDGQRAEDAGYRASQVR